MQKHKKSTRRQILFHGTLYPLAFCMYWMVQPYKLRAILQRSPLFYIYYLWAIHAIYNKLQILLLQVYMAMMQCKTILHQFIWSCEGEWVLIAYHQGKLLAECLVCYLGIPHLHLTVINSRPFLAWVSEEGWAETSEDQPLWVNNKNLCSFDECFLDWVARNGVEWLRMSQRKYVRKTPEREDESNDISVYLQRW